MRETYKNFEIEIFDDHNYTLNSTDNLRQYQRIYFEGNHQELQPYPCCKYAIVIKESGIEISSAFICEIGWTTKIAQNSFIIEDDKIWIIACSKIYCLEISTLELIWQKDFDSFSIFSIYNLEDNFIIHGEGEIFRITKKGEIIWSFGGRDIWINIENKNPFNIESDKIRLFDFESNEYVLDFDGNVIEDNPRIVPKEIKKKWWKIFG